MSEAKRLLEQATPLPWTTEWSDKGWNVATTSMDVGVWAPMPREPNDGSYRQNRDADQADAALIVYAVNRLPDYEAAVEALERIETKMFAWEAATRDAGVYRANDPDQQMGQWVADEARVALARLREGEAAHVR